MGFIPVGAAARRASLLRLLSCCVHVPPSVSPSIRLLAPLGCCEYHSCERRWTEISWDPAFSTLRYTRKSSITLPPTCLPTAFSHEACLHSQGLREEKQYFTHPSPSCFLGHHPTCSLVPSCQLLPEPVFGHLLWLCPSSPGSVKVVTNTVSPRGRATETDLRRISPSPLARCSPYG